MAAPSVAPRNNTTRMEDFNVIKKLGQGSFGVVYSVIRKGRPGGETLVVKQINMGPHKSDQEEAINECRVLAKLDNKHVVKYHESFIDVGNKLCIVMEFAPKGTLHDLIQSRRGQPFSEDTVWKMLLQSTLGLHHIHGHKILHRDVKSENIFLDAGGNCKLGDLGVAKVLSTQVDFARTLVVRAVLNLKWAHRFLQLLQENDIRLRAPITDQTCKKHKRFSATELRSHLFSRVPSQ